MNGRRRSQRTCVASNGGCKDAPAGPSLGTILE